MIIIIHHSMNIIRKINSIYNVDNKLSDYILKYVYDDDIYSSPIGISV